MTIIKIARGCFNICNKPDSKRERPAHMIRSRFHPPSSGVSKLRIYEVPDCTSRRLCKATTPPEPIPTIPQIYQTPQPSQRLQFLEMNLDNRLCSLTP